MNQQAIPLQPAASFHIYNHANGFENVFCKEENFRYFMEKYWLHISPIAETYAYCLLPNHFHLVIQIRKRMVIEELMRNKYDPEVSNFGKVGNFSKVYPDIEIEKYLSKQFANLFSCYTQSFNKVNYRKGSLFIKNFKRILITDKQHFLNEIIYTHRNPIHHGLRKHYDEWDFSSYNEIVDGVCDHLAVGMLLKVTGGLDTFKELHQLALENLQIPHEFE